MEISLRTLGATCVLGPRLALPEVDYLYNPTGANYDHAAFAPAPSINSSFGRSVNIRGGKPFVFKGELLRKLDFVLKTCPYICDVRCYVPVYFTQTARHHQHPDIKLERVITVEARDAPGRYHLHALLTREIAVSKAEKLAKLGVTFERVDLLAFTPVVYENALQLYQGLRLSNVEALRAQARVIASCLRTSSQALLRVRLERLLKRLDRDAALRTRFQCEIRDLNDLYRWAYAAIVLGELPVDLTRRIGPHAPISLLAARRRHVCDMRR